ncbi:MAG: DUF4331 domain-containing protein [Chloroflexia bacterium]
MNTKQRLNNSFGGMKGIATTLASIGILLSALALMVVGSPAHPAAASSHREAPLISGDPQADNTDVYAFVSPDVTNTVTIVANYIPLEEPNGGPNFAAFGDNVQYELRIDNTGDAQADIVYQFRFNTVIGNPNTFLYATGPITSISSPNWNIKQFYSVTRIEGGTSQVLATNLPEPPVNIGPRSTPNYDTLAAQAINTVGNRKFFAGQRDDPFFVDLGSIFDLGGLRPFNPYHIIPLTDTVGIDGLKGFNVHSIIMQVPMTDLTRDHQPPTSSTGTIGVFANASRQAVRVLRTNGTVNYSGNFVQISRLANPLINEVVTHVGQKDFWNSQPPASDKQFLSNALNPELAGLENYLYSPAITTPARTTNRQDLVTILLTGFPGLNFTGNKKADLLRLNMTIPPSAAPDRLGLLAGQFDGFPNGRRLTDDVVDIELRVVGEGYGPILHSMFGLPDNNPQDMLGDGVNTNDKPFLTSFPYVASPWQGYDPLHHTISGAERKALAIENGQK